MSYDEEGVADYIKQAGDAAILWARELLEKPETWVLLDTETTGLGSGAEVIQVAILNPAGEVLLDELVKPYVEIEAGAFNVHHIGREALKDKPNIRELAERLKAIFEGKKIITYNASFDSRLLWQSCTRHEANIDVFSYDWQCAMIKYAEYTGEWNPYRGEFRWQKLQGGDHTAAGDCRATLELIKDMAHSKTSEEGEA